MCRLDLASDLAALQGEGRGIHNMASYARAAREQVMKVKEVIRRVWLRRITWSAASLTQASSFAKNSLLLWQEEGRRYFVRNENIYVTTETR